LTSADGIVGPLTWGALMPECYGRPAPPFPGFLIRQGARGDYVRQIQSCLNAVNNAGLATDGIFGPLTDAAVRNYQRANGLAVDGIVGPITWGHLMPRCGGAVPVIRTAEAAVQTVTVEEAAPPPSVYTDIADSSLGIEYSHNFAATDDTETSYMQETIGTVEPAKGGETVGVEMLTLPQVIVTPDPPAEPTPMVEPTEPISEVRGVDMHKFLMYLLVRHSK